MMHIKNIVRLIKTFTGTKSSNPDILAARADAAGTITALNLTDKTITMSIYNTDAPAGDYTPDAMTAAAGVGSWIGGAPGLLDSYNDIFEPVKTPAGDPIAVLSFEDLKTAAGYTYNSYNNALRYIHIRPGRVEALDGVRIVSIKNDTITDDVLIPAIIGKLPIKEDARVYRNDKNIVISAGNVLIKYKAPEDKFINTDTFFKGLPECKTIARANVADYAFLKSMKVNKKHIAPLALRINDNGIMYHYNNGIEIKGTAAAETKGPIIDISLNPAFLLDAIKTAGRDFIAKFIDNKNPVVITDSDEDITVVVLPICDKRDYNAIFEGENTPETTPAETTTPAPDETTETPATPAEDPAIDETPAADKTPAEDPATAPETPDNVPEDPAADETTETPTTTPEALEINPDTITPDNFKEFIPSIILGLFNSRKNADIIAAAAFTAGIYGYNEFIDYLNKKPLPELLTFDQWSRNGYTVKKGEKSILTADIWKYIEKSETLSAARADEINKNNMMEGDRVYKAGDVIKSGDYITKTAYLFTADQVEKTTYKAVELPEDCEKYTEGGREYIKGNTRPIKDALKAAGYRWHKKRGEWYRNAAGAQVPANAEKIPGEKNAEGPAANEKNAEIINPWVYMAPLFEKLPLMICENKEKTAAINAYQDRRAARIDGLRAAGDRRTAEGEKRAAAGWKKLDAIPFGQPVHGSRDRNFRDKAGKQIDSGYRLQKEAETFYNRANAAENNTAISSDDPLALEKLTEKLKKTEAAREALKKSVMEARKDFDKKVKSGEYVKKGHYYGCRIPEGFTDEDRNNPEMFKALPEWEKNRSVLYHYYNKNGEKVERPEMGYRSGLYSQEIKRIKDRIESLQKRQQQEDSTEEINGITIELSASDNRVKILFGEKPDSSTINKLKSHGFRYSRYNNAWQAFYKPWNIRIARQIVEEYTA